MISRNIKLIERRGPAFLESLGFSDARQDATIYNLRGGFVSYLVRDKSLPQIIYGAHVGAWFGKLELVIIWQQTEGVVLK